MATIRAWLIDEGFVFTNGRIILQYSPEKEKGWQSAFGGNSCSVQIDASHPVLDFSFSNEVGTYGCPVFIADDGEWIYFPVEYDGICSLIKVNKDLAYYLMPEHKLPSGY